MKPLVLRALAVSALLASASVASAASLYDESIDGDLDAVGSTNLALALGVNTISGQIEETGAVSDTDRVKFTQTAGLIVDSIVLSFAGVFDDAGIGQTLNSALFNSVANLFDDNFGQITSGASISAAFFDSFGPETGPLSRDTDGAIWDFQLSAGLVFPAQPWTLTITTSAKPTPPPNGTIPLPGGAPLLLGALGGFALLRRSKRS